MSDLERALERFRHARKYADKADDDYEQAQAFVVETQGGLLEAIAAHLAEQEDFKTKWVLAEATVREYEHALDHIAEDHEGPTCPDCQDLARGALLGDNRQMCREMVAEEEQVLERLRSDITALRNRVGEGWIVRRLNEILDGTYGQAVPRE